MPRLPRAALVATAAGVAVLVNLAVYLAGRAVGGTFTFTSSTGPARVDAVTVAGFTAVPLLLGLTAVALLAPRAAWVIRVALVAGPALAAGTVLAMTLPADFDTVSTITLALCHLTLVPITVAAVLALGRRPAGRPLSPASGRTGR
ncbi:hypothetical protein BJY16_006725 [Actinoplanes octamycinicus]|uniref:Uncharacterized protein n=1 Tax=Actinoplanes octamycinicus TaxID=135948 RepID=A0A7W7MAT9_9ACTN|nr:DUF6069 family protein [Actinoplanes octamycinicus]MBB4743266.1 hypothetical protein [Actinoplanes octamycinicus]GIE63853.1 hypothetical protein Aoc01nite_92550 [Actinoplanes octamycinicus]